jgi:TM2 domain-containing membrane protein YozV
MQTCPSCGGEPWGGGDGIAATLEKMAPSAGPRKAAPTDTDETSGTAGDAGWYYLVNGQQVGPVPTAALIAMLQAAQINLNSLLWRSGMDSWKPVSLIPELLAAHVARPAPGLIAVPQAQTAEVRSRHRGKSKVTAGILALLVGGLGIHKFYLGGWGWGLLYIIFIWTFIPAIVSFIEGIMLLTMSDEAFDRTYNYGEVSPFTW